MTLSFPNKLDMLKERAMYDKAIDGLPKTLYSELLNEYDEWAYGLDEQKKKAIKDLNQTFKDKKEESYNKVDRLFSEARDKSGLELDCEIRNGFINRLRQRLTQHIQEAM